MKKKLLIGLSTFYILVIIAAGAVCVKFWSYIKVVDWSILTPSNVMALYQGLTESPEKIAEKKKKLDSERSQEIRDYINIGLRDYTDEEKEAIESGKKTETEILAQIISEAVEEESNVSDENIISNENISPNNSNDVKPPQNQDKPHQGNETKPKDENNNTNKTPVKNDNNTTQNNTIQNIQKKESAEQIVARHVSRLYGIQRDFEGRVSSLTSSASNWVKAYKKAHPDQTWRDAKVAGVKHFSSTASQIENECYAMVDAQIELLRSDLKAIGADTSIVSTIKSTAYAEMDARKAEIVQQGYAKLNK